MAKLASIFAVKEENHCSLSHNTDQVKRLSSSLSFGKRNASDEDGGGSTGNKRSKENAKNNDDSEEIGSLRRQSTRELINDEGMTAQRKSSRAHAVESVRQATKQLISRSSKASVTSRSSITSVTKTPSGRSLANGKGKSSMSKTNSGKASLTKSGTKGSLSKRTSGPLSKSASLSRKSSSVRNGSTPLSKKVSSVTNGPTTLTRKGSSQTGKKKQPSLSRKSTSENGQPTRKFTPDGRKTLWFPSRSILAVRAPEGGDEFYLCKNSRPVYNYTKEVPVNWLIKKKPRHFTDPFYVMGYKDRVDTHSILMEVTMNRLSRLRYELPDDELTEIMKVVNLSKNVENGDFSLDEIDSDVEPIVLIDEPPKKKPRLQKTASQKLRDKALKTARKTGKADGQTRKRKKAATDDGEPKRKRASKKVNELELHPRPDIKILTKDPLFESRAPMPYISKVANSRLLFRAINLKDNDLLVKLMKDGSRIFRLYTKSVDNSDTPLTQALQVGDKNVLFTILDEVTRSKFKERTENNREDVNRLDKLRTGSYNQRSLGIRFIRKLTASRGSREGNNAFMQEEAKMPYLSYWKTVTSYLTKELLDQLKPYFEKQKRSIYGYASLESIYKLLLAGKNEIAGEMIKSEYGGPFANQLLHEVLLLKTEELTNCSPSTIKMKCKKIKKLSPFHCAAVNPNSKYLEKLLSVQPDVHIADTDGRTPIHYAACCSSTANLRLLLDWGANPNQTDNHRQIPLFYAIKANRPENVEFLLEEAKKNSTADVLADKFGVGGVNRRDNFSWTPLHIAAENKFYEVCQVLLNHGADVNAKLNVSKNQETPLMRAAAQGDLDIVRLLVDNGAVVEQKDRMGRTAVIHACKNGATSVLSYLLHIGASAERADNSDNTPLHYAAAYGWFFTVKLLLEAGVDPNVSNMWKVTPVAVAYFKGHVGIVSELLNSDKVDINFPNDDGVTMIFHACSSDLGQTDLCDQIQYMVEEKGALCSICDNSGQTPLHYLARARYEEDGDEKEAKRTELKAAAYKQSVAIAKLLLKNGCDLNAVDSNGFTAAMVAIGQVTNLPLAKFLLKQGGQITLPPEGDPTTSVLHEMANHILQKPLNLSKLLDLLNKQKFTDVFKKMAQYVDVNGHTPLLLAIKNAQERSVPKFDDVEKLRKVKLAWDAVRNFIKSLVQDLDADLNAKVEKRFFPIEDMPKPESSQWWHDHRTAGKTAVHLALGNDPEFDDDFKISQMKSGTLFKELVRLGANINVYDKSNVTPLATCISDGSLHLLDFLAQETKFDFNFPTQIQVSNKSVLVNPLLFACYNKSRTINADLINKLIDCGCDMNASLEGTLQNCLHMLVSGPYIDERREDILKVVEKLAEKNFDFNALDQSKKAPIHYAVRANNGSMNQSHELEVRLIQLGAKVGLADSDGLTALHYVFSSKKQNADPAELAKLIGRNMTKKEINHQDKMGQTALHYAAKKGATICCMYLLMIGADIDVKDKDGSTALSLAVYHKRDACATTLIQSGASLMSKVIETKSQPQSTHTDRNDTDKKDDNDEDIEDWLKEIWTWKPAQLVKTEEKEQTLSLYQAAIEKDLNGVAMFVTEADSKRSGLTELDAISMAFKTCKYNIALRLLCTTTNLSPLRKLGEHKQNLLHIFAISLEKYNDKKDEVLKKIAEFLIKAGVPADSPDAYGCNPIIYMIINRHFSLADLLSERTGGYNVKYEDGFKRSYLAATLWRSHSRKIRHDEWEFVEKLIGLKLNVNAPMYIPLNPDLAEITVHGKKSDPDVWQGYPNDQTTAFITALTCGDFIITHNFLEFGADCNQPDGKKITPLMHAIMQNKTDFVKQLLNHSYDPKEEEKKRRADEQARLSARKKNKKASKRTGFTLKVTHYDDDDNEESDDEDDSEESDYEDDSEESDDEDDNEDKQTEFKAVKKTSNINLNAKDSQGRTALHYVAQPYATGTFDNAEIAFVLVKAGAKLSKDLAGQNPYDLAMKSGAKKVADVLKKHFKLAGRQQQPNYCREFTVNDGVSVYLDGSLDFKTAAEKMLQRYDSSMEVEDVYVHEVDENCNVKNGELMVDTDQDMYYDVLLTKVDVKRGHWGLYNFYQMQLVYQPGKTLYILFTRWGRIEDDGQFQHTPFTDRALAIKEFEKVFKEKTGNKWADVKNFEQKPRKYRLVEDIARKAPPAQKDINFNLETTLKSVLPKHLYRLISTLMNPKAMQLTMNDFSEMNSESLPFGQLNKERLLEGKKLLDQIEKLVDEVEKYQKSTRRGQDDDKNDQEERKEAYQKNLEKIAELSNDYYHVIPQRNFSCEKIRPLDQRKRLMVQIHTVTNLLDYEVACKMLLAAMHFKKQYNPVDYVYCTLDCKLEAMSEDDPMAQIIHKYIWTGSSGSRYKIHGMYKLARKGEAERLTATGLENRRLLWHGSSTCNLLSILQRGLLVAPPEASVTGWRFGKGIYLSDAFSLSANYIHGHKLKFMLLCEVALGDARNYSEETTEEREKNDEHCDMNSVIIKGNKHYSPSDWFILPSGASIAQGYLKSKWGQPSGNTQYVVKDPAQVCLRYLIPFST